MKEYYEVLLEEQIFHIKEIVCDNEISRYPSEFAIYYVDTQLSGEILPQRKLPRTITLRNISSEIGLIKYIFDVASFEEDLTNRV